MIFSAAGQEVIHGLKNNGRIYLRSVIRQDDEVYQRKLESQKESKNMKAFGLTKMQLLKIVLLLSVFVLSSVLAKGNYGLRGHLL